MKYFKNVILLLFVGVLAMGCDKFQKTTAPTDIATSDMLALFMNPEVEIDQAAAYAKIWRVNFTNLVDEKMAKQTDEADADLRGEVTNAEKVVKKLEALAAFAKGDARYDLNSTVLSVRQTLDKVQRYLDERKNDKGNRKDGNNATGDNNTPTQVDNTPPAAGGNGVSFEGPQRWASPANTQHGFINLRQFPNAKSKSLRALYQWPDRDVFLVRKVVGSKFYGVFENGTLVGYVNGDYICFE